jgi:hypothetical protein
MSAIPSFSKVAEMRGGGGGQTIEKIPSTTVTIAAGRDRGFMQNGFMDLGRISILSYSRFWQNGF